jgi:RNase adaptor protein for sRNA GlmZ degradation
MNIEIVTYGTKHEKPEPERLDVIFPLGHRFKDPAGISDELRYSNGLDPKVIDSVMRQEGAWPFIYSATTYIIGETRRVGSLRVGVSCRGGRHRSVVMGNGLAHELRALWAGLVVAVEHRDIAEPVLVS